MLPDADTFEVSVHELAAWRRLLGTGFDDGSPDLRLVDCREEEEFAFNRIDGAEWIPLSRFAEEAPVKLLADAENESAPAVVIYCHHGMRSLQATHFLRQRGLTQVWSLADGIDAWSLEIDPKVPRY